ncbi:MAG: hypothetical protein J6B62_02760 [Bacteroidales bacterium]|nr:hypothetical protein [Bacteroidales bacterium]
MDANVSYNDLTNYITITTTIYIYGSLATDELAAKYKASIDVDASWGSIHEVQIEGKWYKLSWDISVINIGESDVSFEQNGNNYMEVSINKSYMMERYKGRIRFPRGDADNPMAHEFGHMVGLSDRYIKQNGRTFPMENWEGNIMAEEAGFGVVEPRNIEESLSSSVKAFIAGEKEYKIRLK